MKWFRIDLKTFLGLAMPNQCPKKLSDSKYQAGFGVIMWGQNLLTLMIPINIVLLYYMMIPIDCKVTNFTIYVLVK